MQSREELESQFSGSTAPRGEGAVRYITARIARGIHDVLETAELTVEDGMVGDRWRVEDDPDRSCQITLMEIRVARMIRHSIDQPLHTSGDNFLVDLDLGEEALPVGTRLRMGDALIEITDDPHLGCKKFRERFGEGALAWVNDKGHRSRRLRGVNCRVIEGGMVSVGDKISVVPPAQE